MQHFKVIVIIWGACCIAGCSTTPGDAAYRGGHYQHAAELYYQGAQQGDGNAALKLGLMIEKGKLASSKYDGAAHWYKRACELSNNAGCHNAGLAYEYGKYGVDQDYEKARQYYKKAAENGFMQSQYNLGSLYSNGYFNNDIEGLKWMLIAKKSAEACMTKPLCKWVLDDPPGHRQTLRSRMTQDQIQEARRLANMSKR